MADAPEVVPTPITSPTTNDGTTGETSESKPTPTYFDGMEIVDEGSATSPSPFPDPISKSHASSATLNSSSGLHKPPAYTGIPSDPEPAAGQRGSVTSDHQKETVLKVQPDGSPQEETQPCQQTHSGRAEEGQWHHGLFDCCGSSSLCKNLLLTATSTVVEAYRGTPGCESICCPCILAGRTHARFEGDASARNMSTCNSYVSMSETASST